MVGYKLEKFAPLGVKERHQVVEKKRWGKKESLQYAWMSIAIMQIFLHHMCLSE